MSPLMISVVYFCCLFLLVPREYVIYFLYAVGGLAMLASDGGHFLDLALAEAQRPGQLLRWSATLKGLLGRRPRKRQRQAQRHMVREPSCVCVLDGHVGTGGAEPRWPTVLDDRMSSA